MLNPVTISLLDVVALTEPLPQHHLLAGQVGTVVEVLGRDAYEVEFSNENGETYAQLTLLREQILPLHFSNDPLHDSRPGHYR